MTDEAHLRALGLALSRAQRRLVLAAPDRGEKPVARLYPHAKVSWTVRLPARSIIAVPAWGWGASLTPLGRALKYYLQRSRP